MSEEIVRRILQNKKKVLFESEDITKDVADLKDDLVNPELEEELPDELQEAVEPPYEADLGDTMKVQGSIWQIYAIKGEDYALVFDSRSGNCGIAKNINYGDSQVRLTVKPKKEALKIFYKIPGKLRVWDVKDEFFNESEEIEAPESEEDNTCICGSTNIVEENGKRVCDDCGREISEDTRSVEEPVEESESKYSKESILCAALKLWNSGKYEKAMILCHKYGVSDREFVNALSRSFRESEEFEVPEEELEESTVHDASSNGFDMRSVKSGESVRFTRKGMTDVPVLGKRFKVGGLSGKCTSLTDEEAVMLVEDAELEVIAPEEKSNLEKNIIYAIQTPVNTANRPNLDAAITEALSTLDSFEVKASSGQRYKVSYRSDHTTDIQGIRPYDDADYHWAKSDDSEDIYNIYYKGKRVKSIRTHSSNPAGEVVRELDSLNKNIKPRIIHN